MAQGGASYDINTPDSTTVYKSCYNSLSIWTSPQGNQLAPTCQKYRMAFHAALKKSSMPPQASKPWLKVMRILGYIQIRPWNHLPNFCVSPTPPPTSMTVLGIRCRVCALKAQSSGFQACPLRYTGWPHEEHFNPLLPLLPRGNGKRENQWPRLSAEMTLGKAMGRFPIGRFSSLLSWLWLEESLRPCPSYQQWVSSAQRL